MKIIKYIRQLFKNDIKIDHEKLSMVPNYTYDSWNNKENGQIRVDAYYENERVGFIDFRTASGQVGFINVEDKYRRHGVATILLSYTEKELAKNNINKIWCSCSKDHYFWSILATYSFEEQPHKSVTGCGYSKQIQ